MLLFCSVPACRPAAAPLLRAAQSPLLQAVQSLLKLDVCCLECANSKRKPRFSRFGKRVQKTGKLLGVMLVVVQHVCQQRLGLFHIGRSRGSCAVVMGMLVSMSVRAAVVSVRMTFRIAVNMARHIAVDMARFGVVVNVLVSVYGAVFVRVGMAVCMADFFVDMHIVPPSLFLQLSPAAVFVYILPQMSAQINPRRGIPGTKNMRGRLHALLKPSELWYNDLMKLKAYAKVNLILNVLGKRPDGYHEVSMLMQAISLHDLVTIVAPASAAYAAPGCPEKPGADRLLSPADFEYAKKDLAWKAAVLMAETFRPDLIASSPAGALGGKASPIPDKAIRGLSITIEKNIPAAAGLAGGSADAASVMVGLGILWNLADGNSALLDLLLPLGAKLGSDVPFCIASQLGHPAAIARGRGTELEFVQPADLGVELYFSDAVIPNKTASVYDELRPEDCRPLFDIGAFLAAGTIPEKRALMGNHLQAPAERLLKKLSSANKPGQQAPENQNALTTRPECAILCGAGPTYFTISESATYRTIL